MRTAILIILFVLNSFIIFGQTPDYKLSRSIGYFLNFPVGMTVALDGDLFVIHRGIIAKLKPNGQLVKEIPYLGFAPSHIIQLPNNTLALLAPSLKNGVLIDTSGVIIREFEVPADKDNALNYPTYIEMDYKGNIYISDSQKDAILKYDINGNYLQTTFLPEVDPLVDPYYTDYPKYFAVDRDDNIHVLLEKQGIIQKFDQQGTYISAFTNSSTLGEGALVKPRRFGFNDQGDMVIFDETPQKLNYYSAGGKFIKSVNARGGMGGSINSLTNNSFLG